MKTAITLIFALSLDFFPSWCFGPLDCYDAPASPQTRWECRQMDMDQDGDTDLADFAILQTHWSYCPPH